MLLIFYIRMKKDLLLGTPYWNVLSSVYAGVYECGLHWIPFISHFNLFLISLAYGCSTSMHSTKMYFLVCAKIYMSYNIIRSIFNIHLTLYFQICIPINESSLYDYSALPDFSMCISNIQTFPSLECTF